MGILPRHATFLLAGLMAATVAMPATLKEVMQELDRNMQAVTGAIARDDWQQVARLAPLIASHDEPAPEEKARIVAWLGMDLPNFKAFDVAVHQAAESMGKAAAGNDGVAVIDAFARVQQGCLGCHESYRQKFVAQFHGTP